MKKRLCSGALIAVLLLVLVGCGQQEQDLGDSYVEGSDFQYMNTTGASAYMEFASGEGKEFLIQGHYLYAYDSESQTLLPVCNKADCLHDAETDEGKLADCNAYIDGEDDPTCPRNHISYSKYFSHVNQIVKNSQLIVKISH